MVIYVWFTKLKTKSILFLFQNGGMKNNMCLYLIHVYYMYITSF